MTVLATTSILFVLATTLIGAVAYQTASTAQRIGRVRATHVADAGINAYLYELKSDYRAYGRIPDTGWVTVRNGERYRVVAVPPRDKVPLTIFSTGVASDGTITIAATVRFPTFADYMFLSNADLTLAADAYIDGKLRCNGNVDNAGVVVGKVLAGGTVTGAGRFDRGYAENQPRVDFNQVLTAMDDIMLASSDSGTYFPMSGSYGYLVTVTGPDMVIEKITGGITTGEFTTTPVASLPVPSSGVAYFADNVWLEGSYSKPLTIVSSKDVYLTGSYQQSSIDSTATSGVIAGGNIIVPSWYKKVNEVMDINAALLSQSGRIYADIKQGVIRERINISGSMAYYHSGGEFGTVDKFTGQPVSGFRTNVYTYDQRLDEYPPPLYPVIYDGELKVDTWIEDKGYRLP